MFMDVLIQRSSNQYLAVFLNFCKACFWPNNITCVNIPQEYAISAVLYFLPKPVSYIMRYYIDIAIVYSY